MPVANLLLLFWYYVINWATTTSFHSLSSAVFTVSHVELVVEVKV
jgi:hypothetical protein